MSTCRSYRLFYVLGGLMVALILVSCGGTKKKTQVRKDAEVIKDIEMKTDGEPYDASQLPREDAEVIKDIEMKTDGEPYDASLLPRLLRHQDSEKLFTLAGDRDVTVEFSWQEEPGRADGAALSLRAPEERAPLFQIFSRDHRPFARSGLEVSSLQAGIRYRMTVRRLGSGALGVRVIQASTGAEVHRWNVPLSRPDLLLVVGSSLEALSVQLSTRGAPMLAAL